MVEKWQSGDVGAFEALFHQYQKLVFRTAYLITGDAEVALDVMQEVFVSVWKSRHTFNPEKGKLTTWLHRITVNRCSGRRRQPPVFSLEQAEDKGFELPGGDVPAEALITKEEYARLMKALAALDIKHRSVVVLRYFNELSCEEIAKAIEIPLGTVKSRLHYALKSLRQELSAGEAQ